MNKLYCPTCGQALTLRGESPSRRAYCTNCGLILQRQRSVTLSNRGVHVTFYWKVVKNTSGNNAIREYLDLEDK